jgi:hypothetical protein
MIFLGETWVGAIEAGQQPNVRRIKFDGGLGNLALY